MSKPSGRGRGRNLEGRTGDVRPPNDQEKSVWGQQPSSSGFRGRGRPATSVPPPASAWGPPLGSNVRQSGQEAPPAQPAQAAPQHQPQPSAWGQPRGGASSNGALPKSNGNVSANERPQPRAAPSQRNDSASDVSTSSEKRALGLDGQPEGNAAKYHADKTRGEAARGAIHGSRSRRDCNEIVITRPEHINSKKGTIGRPIALKSNYFQFMSKLSEMYIYQYRVDFRPEIVNSRMRMAMIAQHRSNFGGHCFDGCQIFSNMKLPEEVTEFVSRTREEEDVVIIVKFVRLISNTESTAIQVHNLIMRRIMQGLQLNLVGRNYFDAQASINIPAHHIQLWPGYLTSIRQHESSLLMMAEIQFKLMRSETVYDIMLRYSRENGRNWQTEFQKIVLGMTILTSYNNKTYRIDDIQFDASPTSTFDTNDGPLSYVDYYRRRYSINIRDQKQPLLLSRPRERDARGGQISLICLIPELCNATGYTDAMRRDFRMMQDVAQHTRVNPDGRIRRLLDFNSRLQGTQACTTAFRDWGLDLSRQLVDVPGRVLPPEKILFGGNREFTSDARADWTNALRGCKMFTACELKSKWYVVAPRSLERSTRDFIKHFMQAAQGMNYTTIEPSYEFLDNDKAPAYTQALDKICNYNPMFIMCILRSSDAVRYAAIKKKLFIERAINCQVMTRRTIEPKKAGNLLSVATKVVVQVNSKLGGAPWLSQIPLSGVMIVGFDVYHDSNDKSRSFGALVGSMDLQRSQRFYSRVSAHRDGQELCNELGLGMRQLLKAYKEQHDELPQRIILYRDGVGEGQTNYVFEHEVRECEKVFQQAYDERPPPKFAFVIVSKRINTKFFQSDQRGSSNVPAGTVVDDVVTLPERYDFFIVAQAVNQGTATPTNYNVIYDTFGLPPSRLQQLTYKLCHLYYNWSGTVRVPAVCQYAHKLAYLVGQYLHRAPRPELDNYLYYL